MTALWGFVKKLNRNQMMLMIGLIVAEGPDVAAIANFLGASGIPHLTGIVHFLGWLSTALASAALAWPSIRRKLSSIGLTTPPGGQAPWDPAKDNVVPMVQAPMQAAPLSPTSSDDAKTPVYLKPVPFRNPPTDPTA